MLQATFRQSIRIYLCVLSFAVCTFVVPGLVSATQVPDPIPERHAEESFLPFSKSYTPVLPASERDREPRSVLLLYSIATGTHEQAAIRQVDELGQILSSHWHLDVRLEAYTDVTVAEAATYPYLIFVEQQRETEASDKFAAIAKIAQGKTFWFGCGTHTLTGAVDGKSQITPILAAWYKGLRYAGTEYPNTCGRLPRGTDDYEVLATFTDGGQAVPLVGMFANKHLVTPAFVPSTYAPDTYTLPILDAFHHFFGHHEVESGQPRALLRLEDVNPETYSSGRILRRIHRYLHANDVPFQVAVIPRYRNPEANLDLVTEHDSRYARVLRHMIERSNAVLVQHGYTHQVGDSISADGFEFWDATENQALQFSSETAAHVYPLTRIAAVREAMSAADLPVPDIWETPHYAYSAIDNDAFNYIYPVRYEHIPGIGSLPFIARIDGTVYLPENLGYVDGTRELITEKPERLRQLGGFSDPVASIFWHPWRDGDELRDLVALLQDEGYTFVSAYELIEEIDRPIVATSSSSTAAGMSGLMLVVTDTLVYTVFSIFLLGTVIYLRNVYLVRRHLRQINASSITREEVESYAANQGVSLPKIALFVPARNEALVIANTLRRIAGIDYPTELLRVFVIVDEREYEDDVPRTTKAVAEETAAVLHRTTSTEFIRVVEVPHWYSGVFGDSSPTFTKSTKGRALNYCLQIADLEDVAMLGVLDADGRLRPDVLKEVAAARLLHGSQLLQGPVFQVSNFQDISIVGKAAGLELALHHLTELPVRLQQPGQLQFLAGTNYFVDPACIKAAGGWSHTAFVEDAELAVRLYTEQGVTGDWINAPEVEQSPANFAVYRRQRERWVRGHLDLLGEVWRARLSALIKFGITYKILVSQFRFVIDTGVPILAIYLMVIGAFSFAHPIFTALAIFLIVMSVFIWDTYGFVYRSLRKYIEPEAPQWIVFGRTVALFCFLPPFIIIQAIPRVSALYKHFFARGQEGWYKTERTVESAIQ